MRFVSGCMLLLSLVAAQAVIADDVVFRIDSPDDQSFRIVDSDKPTDRVPAATQETDGSLREQVPSPAVAAGATSGRYLAKFTASYCQPCQRWGANEKQKIIDAGFYVREYDMEDPSTAEKYGDPNRGDRQIKSMPTFVICDSATGEWIGEKIVGYTKATELLQLLKKQPADEPVTVIAVEKAVPAPAQKQGNVSIYNGLAGSSHQNRGTLVDHLLNEGIHRGRHSKQTLEAMTDAQLDALHDQDHSVSGMNYRYSQPRQRGGFFRGWFR